VWAVLVLRVCRRDMVVPLFDCRTACSLFGAGPCCGRGNLSSSLQEIHMSHSHARAGAPRAQDGPPKTKVQVLQVLQDATRKLQSRHRVEKPRCGANIRFTPRTIYIAGTYLATRASYSCCNLAKSRMSSESDTAEMGYTAYAHDGSTGRARCAPALMPPTQAAHPLLRAPRARAAPACCAQR
jgi:hypothetical protein